jgi:putative endonuclease
VAESATQSVGRRNERLAESYLKSAGLTPVTRNFRCRLGEIDLVMLDGPVLVFVEVRYRRPNRFVSAVATVDGFKQRKLCNTAAIFLAEQPQYGENIVRFDVVGIDGPNAGNFTIQWLKDAFRPGSERF